MDYEPIKKDIAGMKKRITAVDKCLDELWSGFHSAERTNTLLDVVMQQVELCCIEMRKTCEKIRPPISVANKHPGSTFHEEIFGEIFVSSEKKIHIRLNALLPHCKFVGGTQYVSDSIIRLLNNFEAEGGKLPCYNKAFVAIVEHCSLSTASAFDNDNKGFKGVVNALKGRLFEDDNQFELSLGLFNVIDEETYCDIFVMPFDASSSFLYEMEVISR